eukprot:TRINITY_DN107549_c0_g1_i1.p2 TRINITY_DN107549_c0_g1~~TRINITY_DN107549_c0_g1_i1.p2  ORF type:complete len:207 (+),score=4.92 TRINITY_DN107549_c0_g1_i1:95-622(+)
MDHYTRGFVYNTLHIEQKYKIEMIDNLCKIYNGADVYNYQLAREGYAFLSLTNITKKNEEIVKIKKLVEKAKNSRVGLWKEWRDEMACLEAESAKSSKLPENWDEEQYFISTLIPFLRFSSSRYAFQKQPHGKRPQRLLVQDMYHLSQPLFFYYHAEVLLQKSEPHFPLQEVRET